MPPAVFILYKPVIGSRSYKRNAIKIFNYSTVLLTYAAEKLFGRLKQDEIKETKIQGFNSCKVIPAPLTQSQKDEADFKANIDSTTVSDIDKTGSDFNGHKVF